MLAVEYAGGVDPIPDITTVARLMGDPARARMLLSLMAGRALTATELARVAGVTRPTASSHLSRLVRGRLVTVLNSGRHRYFRLAGPEVGGVIERLAEFSGGEATPATLLQPADAPLRKARVCYDHLAGDLGVLVLDSLLQQGMLRGDQSHPGIAPQSELFFADFGIEVAALVRGRRPLWLTCMDWTARRHHLSGALGAAILQRCFELRWVRRAKDTRVVWFSATGELALRARFRVQ